MTDEHDETIEERLKRVETVIYGDADLNAIGLMKRVSDIEAFVRDLHNIRTMMKGAIVIMTLTGGANLVALIKAFLWP